MNKVATMSDMRLIWNKRRSRKSQDYFWLVGYPDIGQKRASSPRSRLQARLIF